MENVEEWINISLSVKKWQCTYKVCLASLKKGIGFLNDSGSSLQKMFTKAQSVIAQ